MHLPTQRNWYCCVCGLVLHSTSIIKFPPYAFHYNHHRSCITQPAFILDQKAASEVYNIKQVCSNKHASAGRDKERITDLIAGCLFQILYRCIAGYFQVVCRLLTGYLQSGIHISYFSVILFRFQSILAVLKKALLMDGRTDGRTDPHKEMRGRI